MMNKYLSVEELDKQGYIIPEEFKALVTDRKKKYEAFQKFGKISLFLKTYDPVTKKVETSNYIIGFNYKETEFVITQYGNIKGMWLNIMNPYESKHTNCLDNKKAKPNRFSSPSKNILDKWYEYLIEEERTKIEITKLYAEKEKQFKKQIHESNLPVRWLTENKGEVKKGNLVFSFELCCRYISTSIKIDHTSTLLFKDFILMSNNQYPEQKPEKEIEIYNQDNMENSLKVQEYMCANTIADVYDIFGETPNRIKLDNCEYDFINIEVDNCTIILYIDIEEVGHKQEIEKILKTYYSTNRNLHFEAVSRYESDLTDRCLLINLSLHNIRIVKYKHI